MRVAVIDHGRVPSVGTLDELRQDSSEDLEDIFIRLVGASVAEIESRENSSEEGMILQTSCLNHRFLNFLALKFRHDVP